MEVKEILIKESENISKQIKDITEKYKDLATENEMDEFKTSILNAIEGIKGFKHSPYSIIRINTVDEVGSAKELKSLIENVLQIEFQEGAMKDFTLYKEKVWISFHNDGIEFWMLGDKQDDSLMVEVKDLVLNELIKNFNARKVCLYTQLADGYKNWDFFDCENYIEPKKSWLTKLAESLGS